MAERKPATGVDALVGTKTRQDPPYLVFKSDDGWTWKVLKRNGKSAKDFASWFMDVSSPMTWGGSDMGDTYVRDVILHARLFEVDGRAPTTEDTLAVSELWEYHANRPDPMKALGF